ncbi:tetratricopeptide repeat protein [Pendulispora rubella]|uniref:Tetratricopeptide repeat protein n=1 Tax=Pendulispora rubella TaxID=2741070 RepID=A0ABZ2L1U8_9BACT
MPALLFLAVHAHADDKKSAGSHFQRAVTLYGEADYGAALVEFKQAYQLSPNVNVLYNIAQAQFQLQRYAQALSTFEQYLSEGGESHRPEVLEVVATLQSRVGRLDIHFNVPGTELQIDDEEVAAKRLGKPLTVSVGRRKLVASARGYHPKTQWIDVAAGENVSVDVRLDALEPTPAAVPKEPVLAPAKNADAKPRESQGGPVVIGWTVTAALAAATAVTGIFALKSASDLKSARDAYPADKSDIDSKASKATTFAVTTDVLGGLTLVAAGVSLYWTLTLPSKNEAKVSVAPTGIRFSGSF